LFAFMSTVPDDDDPSTPRAAGRVIPRKLSLRVAGTRIGTSARPAAPGPAAAAPRRAFGLRVHSSTIAPHPASATLEGDPYSVDDHDRR
jgi:hypothetical protein